MEKKQITFSQARRRALLIALAMSCFVFLLAFIYSDFDLMFWVEFPIYAFILSFAMSFILLSRDCSDIKKNPVSYDPEWEKNLKEKLVKQFERDPNKIQQDDDFDEWRKRLHDHLHEQRFYHYYWDID